MEVVPVIDLKDSVVARARLGDRASYQPIETPLSRTSKPLDVVAGLLSVHPFRTLYVADLDAIEGRGNAGAILDDIAAAFPGLELWVDNGCSDLAAAHSLLRRMQRPPAPPQQSGGGGPPKAVEGANDGRSGHVRPLHHASHGPPPPSHATGEESRPSLASLVLGSESQRDIELLRALHDNPRIILSLDFRGDRFLGPQELLERAELWPRRIIVMTLARVGSGVGPDFDRYKAIRARAGERAIYLAGGLRDANDLAAVRSSGAAGILVASALHDGRIKAADLMSV
ncbi:MAG: HisA/HisF-related TIM barrel protein [Propylenella sp.]